MAEHEANGGLLAQFSDALAQAVETAGRSVVAVKARRRFPGSGVLWAPAGTPPAVVDRLAGVLAKVLATPEMKARFAAQGTEVFLLPPKEFAAYVQADAKRLTDLIKSANIQGE